MFDENTENSEERDNAVRAYDSHLLMGHFTELDESPAELVSKNLADAEHILLESKSKKGADKILLEIDSLKLYATALTLKDRCSIEDIEGLFSFICVRYPNLELDWSTLQKIILASTHRTVDYSEQKTLELAITIYISAILRELKTE